MTSVLLTSITESDARRLTERIRVALDRFSTSWVDLAERVTEAYNRRADLALGYDSWAEYASAEFHPAEGLAASVRSQVVGLLSASGMSTRAIAPVAGVSFQQVAKIAAKTEVSHQATPAEPTTPAPVALGSEVTITPISPTPEDQPITGTVVGLDGKTYTRERPSETAERVASEAMNRPTRDARKPITDAFWEATYDAAKQVDKLARLVSDDRFNRNRDAIATKNLSQMRETANTLARVLAAIETDSHQGV